MKDLANPNLIRLKGMLFLACGLLASAELLIEHPTPRTAVLLALSVWCFARFYYFSFYVIGRYVDPTFRFAGLWSFASYVASKRAPRR